MLPELKAIAKQLFLPHLTDKMNTLELKYEGGTSFDAVSAGWYLRNGYPNIYALMAGGLPAWSGETVSLTTALNNSVVWACNRIISESIGYIPAILMQQKGNSKQPATDHPMYMAMKMAPNDEISAQGFTETETSHCVMQGNGFAQILRRSGTGTAIQLNLLQPQNVLVDREKTGAKRLVYEVKEHGAPNKPYAITPGKPQDILHLRGLGWDGVRGYSVITMARQSIGSAIAAERNVARFWAHGGRAPYHLELLQKFKTDDEFAEFREDWERIAQDPNKAPIVEPYFKYVPSTLTMKEAQMLESRLFSVSEICRWFSVSPHLVQDLSHATFSNIENLALQFVVMTLSTWLGRWEQDFWRCVLTAEEKAQGYYLKHNVNALLRGDFRARMEGYASALQNGHMSIDEIRDLEDRNPLPNNAGSHHHIQLNMQDVEKIGEGDTEAQPKKGLRRIV